MVHKIGDMRQGYPQTPFFSVVIPLYNKEDSISKTIHSVLSQTFESFEIIVVNDGSKDNGLYVVQEIKDSRIKIISQENAGVSAARNRGVEAAVGEYILFLDGDDHWKENHLKEILSLITEYSSLASVFVTNFVRRFPDGDTFVNRVDIQRGVIENYFKLCFKAVVIHTSCICVEREILLSKGFKEKYSMGEDIDLWNRIARKYKIAYTPSITSVYEIDAPNNSCSRPVNYKKDAAREALRGVSCNIYDISLSVKRYFFFLIKRAIKYRPRVVKPTTGWMRE